MTRVETDYLLKLETPAELVSENIAHLSHACPPLLLPSSAKQVEPGLWISRGVVLDPKARLTPPLFLGEHCHIHANSHIGPNAIVENGSIVSNESTVRNSIVCQNSFVGEGIDIHDSIVDGNKLFSIRHNAELQFTDDFLLSHIHTEQLQDKAWRIIGRVIGTLLCLITLPLIALLTLIRPPNSTTAQHTGKRRRRSATYTLWHFSFPDHRFGSRLLNRLPSLINVTRGELELIGLAPISCEQFAIIPDTWREMIAQTPQGWLTILDLEGHVPLSKESWAASQAFYSAQAGCWFDLRLIWNWCKRGFGLQRYV